MLGTCIGTGILGLLAVVVGLGCALRPARTREGVTYWLGAWMRSR